MPTVTVPTSSEMSQNVNRLVKFINCRLLRDHAIVVDDLWVRGGVIVNPEKVFFDERVQPDEVVNCGGRLISPGFIDVQINGAFGIDFSVSTETLRCDIQKVAHGLMAHGVTSFCPTVITSGPDIYEKVLPQFMKTKGNSQGAGVLGLHLEGPFINKEKKGAHVIECIASLPGGIDDVTAIYGSLENVSIITLAPELPGALDVIRSLSRLGIITSLGHSMANLSEGEAAVTAGARFITHLFNAMLPFHHRDPHLVGLLASNNLPSGATVFYGIIADGIHTHSAALRIAYRAHPNGLVLVTDAVPAMGLAPGTYHLGAQVIEVSKEQAIVAGTNTLCGSIATMNQCIKFFYESTGCSAVEALECATLHPAQLLGVSDRKGTLEYGRDADFVLLDENLDVHSTYIAGEQVWTVTHHPVQQQ